MPAFSGDDCGSQSFRVSVSVSGSAHFGADQATNIDQIVGVTSSYSIPLACFAQINSAGGPALTCDTFGGVIEGKTCTQSATSGDIPSMVEGTYTSADGKLTIETPDDYVLLGLATVNPDIDYCVRGDQLTLRLRDASSGGEPQVYEATRASGT
jgi:hypothetical protein